MKSARTKNIQTPTRKFGGMKPHYDEEVQKTLDEITKKHAEHQAKVATNKARRYSNSKKLTTKQKNHDGIRPLMKWYAEKEERETFAETQAYIEQCEAEGKTSDLPTSLAEHENIMEMGNNN